MNTPLISVIIVIVLIVGSTLSVMNKACKSGHHAWCAPCPPYGIILKLSRRPDCDCRPESRATVLARDTPCFIAHKLGRNVRFTPKSGHCHARQSRVPVGRCNCLRAIVPMMLTTWRSCPEAMV